MIEPINNILVFDKINFPLFVFCPVFDHRAVSSMRRIFFMLCLVMILEIVVIILSGKLIGLGLTFLFIILTGIIGAYLAKQQGLEIMHKARQQLQYGQIPSEAIIDGICILLGGILLITPGFITDFIGLFLLLPFTRKAIKPLMIHWIKHWINKNTYIYFKRR